MKLNYKAKCTRCEMEQSVELTLFEKFMLTFFNEKLIYRSCSFCCKGKEKEVFEILEG